MPPPQSSLFERLAGLIAWLAERLAGAGPAVGSADHGLNHPRRDALIARLRRLASRLVAIADTPPPPPAARPLEPCFVPTHRLRSLSDAPPSPGRPRLPVAWCWLAQILPPVAAARAELEALLRAPTIQAGLAADPRLGRILRPLGWMLGVDRALLPAARRRRRVILVSGGPAQAAAAAAVYAAGRAKGTSAMDLIALCCDPPPNRRDRRPVWRVGSPPLAAEGAA